MTKRQSLSPLRRFRRELNRVIKDYTYKIKIDVFLNTYIFRGCLPEQLE